ncbi:hypothetical protein C0995_009586 [Termitomyces sp. Mi166|nr:hypothetical protein C0995_009586 [Termitomyces sp. Mi166\
MPASVTIDPMAKLESVDCDSFSDAITSSLITPHSVAQIQNLLDSLDSTSESSKDEFLSFFVQSMFQSFLSSSLRLQYDGMGTNTRLPLLQNISTRNGMHCLVKDQWSLPNDVHPSPTSIHLRFVCLLELVNRSLKDFSTSREFMSAMYDAFKAHADVATHCNWIHGDVTPMNILIDRNGKGVLTDYDHESRNKESSD